MTSANFFEPRFAKDVYEKWPAQTLRTPFRQGLAPNCCAPKNAGPAMTICVWKIGKSKLLRPLVLGPRFGVTQRIFGSNWPQPFSTIPTQEGKTLEPRFTKDVCKKWPAQTLRTPFRQGRVQKMACPNPQNPVSPRTCTKNGLPKPSEPRFAKDLHQTAVPQRTLDQP